MPFSKGGDPNINRAGRPKGAKEKVVIPVRVEKALVQMLTERAMAGNENAQESLALLLFAQKREAVDA